MIRKIGLFIAMAAACSLTACGSQRAENDQLKQQVDQLKQQVADLQSQSQNSSQKAQSQSGGMTDESYAVSPNASDSSENAQMDETLPEDTTATESPTENITSTDTPTNLAHHDEHAHYDTGVTDASALAALIQDLSQRINDATPTGSVQEQREQFYNLKGEIDLAEKDLDMLEDDLEAQYRAGNLDRSAYQTQEQELDALDDLLDRCEDQLEYLFGIDD